MGLWDAATDKDAANAAFGDPAGYLTGTNKEGFSGVKKMLFGDPDKIKAAYDQMMQTASQMTNQTRQFLGNQENKALGFFQPVNHILQGAYGTEGMQGPQVPSMSTLAGMYTRGR